MEATKYVGATWRSRYLRAPKAALTLSAQRGFVQLSQVATARLGLKTGADKFFYVTRITEERTPGTMRMTRQRGVTSVKGYNAWRGDISTQDLLPSILNPHQLWNATGRVFLLPKLSEMLYLYPRERAPSADLGVYIRVGELAGIHKKALVEANASPKRWYRQARGMVRSRWALPYNSAYDYGAWDNAPGAVLNGRFVGVDPMSGVDTDVLGAVLNSTLVMASRLLEGTATGVEGAFDVGPPAVRRMVVPDPRLIVGRARDELIEILDDLRRLNVMPPGPALDLSVDPLRRRLDEAVLVGLGYTKGEASSLLANVYESYVRWRRAVAGVEQLMQVNRRQMSQTGQSRRIKPTDLAARRVWEELSPSVPFFPHDLLLTEDETEKIDIARNFKAPEQKPMFDPGLVMLTNGKNRNLGSYERVRYAAVLLRIGFEPPLEVLSDPVKCASIADRFVTGANQFRVDAREKAGAYVSEPGAKSAVVDSAERLWLKACRERGMLPPRPKGPTSVDPATSVLSAALRN